MKIRDSNMQRFSVQNIACFFANNAFLSFPFMLASFIFFFLIFDTLTVSFCLSVFHLFHYLLSLLFNLHFQFLPLPLPQSEQICQADSFICFTQIMKYELFCYELPDSFQVKKHLYFWARQLPRDSQQNYSGWHGKVAKSKNALKKFLSLCSGGDFCGYPS